MCPALYLGHTCHSAEWDSSCHPHSFRWGSGSSESLFVQWLALVTTWFRVREGSITHCLERNRTYSGDARPGKSSSLGEMRSSQLSYFKIEMTVVLSKAGKTEIKKMMVWKACSDLLLTRIKGVSHSSKRHCFLFGMVLSLKLGFFTIID